MLAFATLSVLRGSCQSKCTMKSAIFVALSPLVIRIFIYIHTENGSLKLFGIRQERGRIGGHDSRNIQYCSDCDRVRQAAVFDKDLRSGIGFRWSLLGISP